MKKMSSRRALGDIGNIVGAPSTKCRVKQAAGAENQAVGGKKSITVSNRPVTRQLVATLAKNQHLPQVAPIAEQHVQWGAQQRRTMASEKEKPNIKSMEDCNVLAFLSGSPRIITRSRAALLKIDENESMLVDSSVDDKEDTDDSSDMEIEAEDQVPNIDEGDENNPLAVSEYIKDMSRLYRETEVNLLSFEYRSSRSFGLLDQGRSCVPPNYMCHQTDINQSMRAVVVDWIIEVYWEYDLMPETLFLTINIMDRYLSSQRDLRRNELQLVGIAAMLVACKYEEINVPCVQDFLTISNHIYTENDVLQMESSMLRALEFNIYVPTPYVFLNRFLKAAQADTNLEMVSSFLVELCLVEYVMLKYPPSMLAAAAVYIGQHTLRRFPLWNRTIEHYTAYTEDDLQECAKLMVGFHENSWKGKLIAVHKKYSTEKFSSVAQLALAPFIAQRRL